MHLSAIASRSLVGDGGIPIYPTGQPRHRERQTSCKAFERMSPERCESPTPAPTSVQLSRMLDRVKGARVSIKWLLGELGERSFGLTLLILAVIALLPGASTPAGVLIAWPAVQLVLGHETVVLPRLMARREVDGARLARAITALLPRLTWAERLIRPRWPSLFRSLRQVTGVAMLLLGLTLILPMPFTQVVPALVIMLLALAYLEEDGCVLLLALLAALCSLTVTGMAVWGAVETIDWLDPATPG